MWAEETSRSFHLLWRPEPSSSSTPEPTCRKRSASSVRWQWLRCVVGKGPVQQLIRGLPVLGGEQQYVVVPCLSARELGSLSLGPDRGCSQRCYVVAVLRVSVKACAGSELELTAEPKRQAERCGLCSCCECVCKVFCNFLSSSTMFLLNVALLCVLTVAV